jgi:poly(glycerol-phosphate) alpha-glucosyltransferase
MIKVANLTASISRQNGGIFDAVLRLTQSHNRQKFDERVFGLRDASTDADLPKWAPVPATAFAATGWRKPIGYSPKFAETLHEFFPEVCHTHGLWVYTSVATKEFCTKTNRPYLVSPHGMLDPWALQNSRWKKLIAWTWFEGAHLRGARCLRALCQSEADSIRKLRLKNPIAVIPNGIDLPGSTPPSPPPWKYLVTPGKKVLLYLSRIHPKKGLVNLLKAWATLQKEKSDWVLAIAGWDQGRHETELKLLCAELEISFADLRETTVSHEQSATVLFLGPQFNDAKSACYHHCDAFVLPSFSEGLPMVVLEAWANAKPVLMTPECNLPEGFQVGAAVKITTTESGVAGGLRELFKMSGVDRTTMGQRARNLVEQRFTWPHVAGQIEEVYAWMLGGGPKPDCISDAC